MFDKERLFHRAAGASDLGAYRADLGAYGADLGAYGADMSDAEMAQLVAALNESERTHKEELAARQAMKVQIRQPARTPVNIPHPGRKHPFHGRLGWSAQQIR